MCGRYYIDEEMLHEIKKITRKIDEKFGNVRIGEILPSQNAMVLTGKIPELSAEIMQWGFPRYDNKGLIINARAESVKEKKTFRDSAIHRRCIVPAAHYFEWDKEKSKTTLSRTDEGIVYMAGIYQYFQNVERFMMDLKNSDDDVEALEQKFQRLLFTFQEEYILIS